MKEHSLRDIVITGMGILSPIGIGRVPYWEGLTQGKTDFKAISFFDIPHFSTPIAGEISNFDPSVFLGKKGLRTLDRSTKLINSAAKLAIEDSQIEIMDHNSRSIGVSLGTTFGSLQSIFQFDRERLTEGPRYVNPSLFPNTVINSPASQVSIRFNIKGFNTTISTGFCAGLDAVIYAADFIKLNRAEAVLAGGVEELCEEIFLGFYNLGYLSGMNGSEPICCPFDARRNGIVLSEGAAVLLIEDSGHANRRGANILAKIISWANTFDPSYKKGVNLAGEGLGNAIKMALRDRDLDLDDIDYIVASANSTKALDRMETRVIKQVFGKHAFHIPISSIKSMIGETFSASGAFSLAAAVGALNLGMAFPTVNYTQRDPECDLDYVPSQARKKDIGKVLVVSADPYGHNSAIVLGRYE